jgi:hypothetical protein
MMLRKTNLVACISTLRTRLHTRHEAKIRSQLKHRLSPIAGRHHLRYSLLTCGLNQRGGSRELVSTTWLHGDGARIRTLAAIARRYLARRAPGARDQSRPRFLLSAARAAATAASTSSEVPAGISPAQNADLARQRRKRSTRAGEQNRAGWMDRDAVNLVPMAASVVGLTTGRRRPSAGARHSPSMKSCRCGIVSEAMEARGLVRTGMIGSAAVE